MNRRQFIQASSLASAAALLSLSVNAADAGNEIVLSLDPSPEHPRLSEGAFVTLKSGKILFIYTRFRGGAADHSAASVVDLCRRAIADRGGRGEFDPGAVRSGKTKGARVFRPAFAPRCGLR